MDNISNLSSPVSAVLYLDFKIDIQSESALYPFAEISRVRPC